MLLSVVIWSVGAGVSVGGVVTIRMEVAMRIRYFPHQKLLTPPLLSSTHSCPVTAMRFPLSLRMILIFLIIMMVVAAPVVLAAAVDQAGLAALVGLLAQVGPVFLMHNIDK